ncbi:4-hydroxy-tetrahydrodipicolinate synthase [Romeriopsis navalis]|uniref:4-hydroxy-tetrahydrodipicolinate synthase n=1 Tax=Romeriopsis navalis TaxID=2992132 RepID=UPI0021F85290|nr:4-hydroxy-tetrahydrodipicolinate synthase [Romeriopsis navalis]
MTFGRVLTAMITPFDQDGAVNYAETEKIAAYLSDHGTDTVVVCGTTGESPTLTWDEEFALFKVVKSAVAGKAKVMAGTGSNSTSEAIEATQKAASLGLDGSLQVVPYYNKPPQEGLYQHFRAIAEASEMPIMLYNVPGRTSQNLLPETVARLAELPNIVAIKEASGNLDQASHIRRLTPTEFGIYSGDDSLTLPLLSVGGCGVVSVASHLVGNDLQQMIQLFEQGQVKKACEIHLKLLPLCKSLFVTTNPIPLKSAMRLTGWNVGECRSPLCEADDDVVEMLRQTLSGLSLL